MNDSLKKIKKFVRKHKETIMVSTAVAVPLIVLNVKFFQANRAWASRKGCHDHSDHVYFTDKTFKNLMDGRKWGFGTGNGDPDDIMVMTGGTYDKEWNAAKDFLRKHGLLEEFYKKS